MRSWFGGGWRLNGDLGDVVCVVKAAAGLPHSKLKLAEGYGDWLDGGADGWEEAA
jgi:hypothetical protein